MEKRRSVDEKKALKKELLFASIGALEHRIENARAAMQDAQDSANSEEKSSAGDKYETGRAMSQQNRDMFGKQHEEAKNEMSFLKNINPDILCKHVIKGSVVICNEFNFFISAGLGTVTFDEKNFVLLSPKAPLAMAMNNKTEGEKFTFNGKEISILEVF